MGVELVTAHDPSFRRDLDKYLEGVTGVVEATSFERFALWRENHEGRGMPWEENRMGLFFQVGKLADRPVTVQMQSAVVQGQKIIFYDAPSQVVDHVMIDEWLEAYLPRSARDANGRLNKTDANNFHSVLHR